jgi:hypothetical protein
MPYRNRIARHVEAIIRAEQQANRDNPAVCSLLERVLNRCRDVIAADVPDRQEPSIDPPGGGAPPNRRT